MGLEKVSAGRDVPHEINVVIEIPAHSTPVKYEIDKLSGLIFVDRFLATSMHYPCNYGFIPQTLSEDGDPLDVLVVTPVPLISGSVIPARPVGVLRMTDESGRDMKILAVPTSKLSSSYNNVMEPDDLPIHQLEMISHFFERYKDLEPGKWAKVEGWASAADARAEILKAVAAFSPEKTTAI